MYGMDQSVLCMFADASNLCRCILRTVPSGTHFFSLFFFCCAQRYEGCRCATSNGANLLTSGVMWHIMHSAFAMSACIVYVHIMCLQIVDEYPSSTHLSNHLHDSDVHAPIGQWEARNAKKSPTTLRTTGKTANAAFLPIFCCCCFVSEFHLWLCTYRRRLGNRRLLLMPGIVAIGVTLNSGVVNCNRFEPPPPLFRFKIGVDVARAAGSGFVNVSNSMSSPLIVVPMPLMPFDTPALLLEFELIAIVVEIV